MNQKGITREEETSDEESEDESISGDDKAEKDETESEELEDENTNKSSALKIGDYVQTMKGNFHGMYATVLKQLDDE